jgi:hypothetical protein
MKLNILNKRRWFYCVLIFVPALLGACNQKNGETKSTTPMENTSDTSSPVRHMFLPEASPFSLLTQFIGVTELSVRYHRPRLYNDSDALQNRIPYDQVWSPGHRLITKFYTSDTVMIKDKKLPAGLYSLLMIPGDKAWVIIFNTDTLFDIRQYDEKSDVLRITADVQKNQFTKDFTFNFSDIQPNSTVMQISWATTSIQLPIFVNNEKKVTQAFEAAFAKAGKDDWQIYMHAADYCLQTCVSLDKGIEWIDKSIAIKETHANTWEKAEIYAEKADYKNAVHYGEKANELGKTNPDPARQKHFDDAIAMWKQKADKKQSK